MYSTESTPLAISHRGLTAAAPENTIPAFLAALEAGAAGIELDVHGSADDVLFVHHDAAVGTQDGMLPFARLDSKDIAKLTLDGQVKIPTLDETLAEIGSRALVFIEIKASGIESAVARCLRRHMDNIDRYSVHAFDHRIVKRVLELIPSVRTGALQVSYLLDTVGALRKAGATDLWQHADFIDASLVTDVHAAGGRVVAWTPNGESQWTSLAAMGVDAVCTDRIDAFVNWAREKAAATGTLHR
jgi:glycerophosphoryl diester phosphodiesterase